MEIKNLIAAGLLIIPVTACREKGKPVQRPNILFAISDDQSFPHAGAYGTAWVKTPAFDRVAKEGLLFTNAYTPNAKSSPSRSCIITGRNSWQLEEAGNHVPYFPPKFKSYIETLSENGYFTGYTGKGWAPGNPGELNGKPRELTGPAFNIHKQEPPARFISNIDYATNFEAFLDANTEGKPFHFWYGGHEPHRAYEFGTGMEKGGKTLDDIDRVFSFWPENDTVRTDMLDYAFEIEHFDNHLEQMLEILRKRNLLENTIVVVTSDNGMPFPRIKGHSFEYSNHLPLAVMWPKGIKNPGRTIDAYISFIDFAPSILEWAGITQNNSGMQAIEGISMADILKDKKGASRRDFVLFGKERTDLGRPFDQGYPIRGIIQNGYLYLRNFEPDRWPSGNPETGYMDCDGSPVKTFILNERRLKGHSFFWNINFGKRPAEELYNIEVDPDCMNNLSENKKYEEIKNNLHLLITKELKREGDPRILGNGHIFDTYPYARTDMQNFYERFMSGEPLQAGWINPSDIEKEKTP